MNEVEKKIENFFKKYSLLDSSNKLLIAFSGGADSLCLLHCISQLSKKYQFSFMAAHLNHNWRAEESEKEEFMAKKFCLDNNIKYYSEKLSEGLPKTELEARNQRYAFFSRVAKANSITSIITGHTKTDQVETLLYRIIKGTGITGLRGIPEVRAEENKILIFRPILELSREQTYSYCEFHNLEPAQDSSNLDQHYLRNSIRLSLIPKLREYNLNIEDSLLRLSCIASDSENIINEYLEKINKNLYFDEATIKTEEFLRLSSSLKRRVIFDFLINNKIDYDFEKISDIICFIQEKACSNCGKTLSLNENIWLFVSRKKIALIQSLKPNILELEVPVKLNDFVFHEGLNITFKITDFTEKDVQIFSDETSKEVLVDLSNIKQPLTLRTRRPGDSFQPFGLNTRTKLKKFLINKGIPKHERDKLPLLVNNDEVLWIVGIGISEKLRVKAKPSHIMIVD